MDLTAEAPTHFRSTGVRPGPIGSLREAVVEVLARRRLIRYLVQADLKKKGADTLLGNLWWVIDPLLQMLVYVVLVSVIFQRGGPDYPLFIFSRDPAVEVVHDRRSTTASPRSPAPERLIKQIQFPKLVLPVASRSSPASPTSRSGSSRCSG